MREMHWTRSRPFDPDSIWDEVETVPGGNDWLRPHYDAAMREYDAAIRGEPEPVTIHVYDDPSDSQREKLDRWLSTLATRLAANMPPSTPG